MSGPPPIADVQGDRYGDIGTNACGMSKNQ